MVSSGHAHRNAMMQQGDITHAERYQGDRQISHVKGPQQLCYLLRTCEHVSCVRCHVQHFGFVPQGLGWMGLQTGLHGLSPNPQVHHHPDTQGRVRSQAINTGTCLGESVRLPHSIQHHTAQTLKQLFIHFGQRRRSVMLLRPTAGVQGQGRASCQCKDLERSSLGADCRKAPRARDGGSSSI